MDQHRPNQGSGERLPSSQANPITIPSSSSSFSPSSSSQQSPPTTAFLRSATASSSQSHQQHQQQQQQQQQTITLAIKCPSVDREPALITLSQHSSIYQVKETIQRTWPGGPEPEGMRCIKAGRLLSDEQTLLEILSDKEKSGAQPVSLHLVIRPDAWSQPSAAPLSSAASTSFQRSNSTSIQSNSNHHPPFRSFNSYTNTPYPNTPSLTPTFRDHLAGSPYFGLPPLGSGTPVTATPSVNLYGNSSWGNQINSVLDSLLKKDPAASARDPAMTSPMAPPFSSQQASDPWLRHLPTPEAISAYHNLHRFIETLQPQEYMLLWHTLKSAQEEYFDRYERLYNQSLAELNPKSSAKIPAEANLPASDDTSHAIKQLASQAVEAVEREIVKWGALPHFEMEGGHRQGEAETAECDEQDLTHHYQQVNYEGLPYILKLSSTPADRARSEVISSLLFRIHTLDDMLKKVRLLTLPMHTASSFWTPTRSRSGQQPGFRHAMEGYNFGIGAPGAAGGDAQMGMFNIGFGMRMNGGMNGDVRAQRQRVFRISLSLARLREIGQIAMPLFFLTLKMSFLVYVFTRNASLLKVCIISAMAAAYIAYEAWGMVARRMRRDLGRENVGVNDDNAVANNGQGRGAPRPAGADVPNADSTASPLVDESHNSDLTPRPVRAPLRYRETSMMKAAYWVERISFIGLDSEDRELGLVPYSSNSLNDGTAALDQDRPRRVLEEAPLTNVGRIIIKPAFRCIIVPALLFVATLIPEIEQKRRMAIEDRADVLRRAAREEEERLERLRQRSEQAARENKAGDTTSAERGDSESLEDHRGGPHDARLGDVEDEWTISHRAVARSKVVENPYTRRLLAADLRRRNNRRGGGDNAERVPVDERADEREALDMDFF
ncbi:hypothetical protein IE53DRAFT_390059 [Violaceomyces palustris]|uniref:Uncharacterized protein n=1 Tax=Violaceomyces palustris TaxID=1673888 RepID=A0ACD0NPV8_9BASI|nr:hypothetical protein IE53DRAFT_390059 [Violaceomyces palustris]